MLSKEAISGANSVLTFEIKGFIALKVSVPLSFKASLSTFQMSLSVTPELSIFAI